MNTVRYSDLTLFTNVRKIHFYFDTGSLSSSHASSKGSLSSLSFTDIYGLSTTTPADPAMLDLHRRVDKILSQGGVSPVKHSQLSTTPQIQTPHRQSITELTSIEEVAPQSRPTHDTGKALWHYGRYRYVLTLLISIMLSDAPLT